MGLDMYLIKRKKGQKDFENWWNENSEVMYWRKANAIHQWFVDFVQDGEDDCDYYKVMKEDVESLRDRCKKVLDNIVMEKAKVCVGQKWNAETNSWERMLEDGEKISNPELCDELLPTQSGFFFGSTDYDQWYLKDIKDTYEKMEEILSSFDFTNYDLFYHSSW